ncbi:hypothetical protein GC174_07000 [bacterium]|nr:hypothetical protein [bacterium]
MFRKKLTEVAVESVTEYLEEKLEYLKTLDLDKDGQKDVDQITEIVKRCGNAVKDVLDTTDFAKMATGLEQIITGTEMIGKSFDPDKVKVFANEFKVGATKLGELTQLGITEVKNHQKNQNS